MKSKIKEQTYRLESDNFTYKPEVKKDNIRQFFYKNKQFDESLISTLERTYKGTKKTEDEWVEIMIEKKIVFK